MSVYQFKVAGVTFEGRQTLIARAAGVAKVGRVFPYLCPEPNDPYDPDAIGVYLYIQNFEGGWDWTHIGYVPRSMTWGVRQHLYRMKWIGVEFPYHTNFGAKITYEVDDAAR